VYRDEFILILGCMQPADLDPVPARELLLVMTHSSDKLWVVVLDLQIIGAAAGLGYSPVAS